MIVWTAIFGAVLIALGIKYMMRKRYKLPPGPRGLPFFGNFFQIDQKAPQLTMTKWSECYGDVFQCKVFGRHTVVLNNFETIYDALVTKSNDFAGREDSFRRKIMMDFANDIGFSTFSPKWLSMKKLTMQTLKMYGDTLENLEVITLNLIDDLLEDLKRESSKGLVDLFPIVHRCTNGIITSIVFGKKVTKSKVQDLLEVTDQLNVAIQPTQGSAILDIVPWARLFPTKAYSELVDLRDRNIKWFTAEIAERKAEHVAGDAKCFLDGLFDKQTSLEKKNDEHKLSDKDIYGIVFDMIFAGTNTTSTTIYCLIAILVNKPEMQEKIAAEIHEKLGSRAPCLADRKSLEYIDAMILEVLRYSSILPLNLPHCTTVDTTISGYDIPKDTQVLFNLWKLHYNPEYWDEPWEFKPERFLDGNRNLVKPDHINRKRLLSFGASRRVCVGENLAKNRLFLMVTSLLQHFKFLPAGPDQIPKHDPREYKAGFLRRPQQYYVKLSPRQ